MFLSKTKDGRKIRNFTLSESFLSDFKEKQPKWGFNGLGYFIYKRTYARVKPNETTEEYWETCRRVVEGVYNVQKQHCKALSLPWDDRKAQSSAQEMFQRMWDFKFLPPGRGLWAMGTDLVYTKGSAALNNCGFVTTKHIDIDFAEPFLFLMDMSMYGVGVGGDCKGAGKIMIQPMVHDATVTHIVEDSREGWVNAVKVVLDAAVGKCKVPNFDYSQVRPKGALIKGFGGIASGPGPLEDLIKSLINLLQTAAPTPITSTHIVDIFNYIGKCVVSGGVRRCLPKGTLVHTSKGLVPIEDVKVGWEVVTSKGMCKVTDWVEQGIQPISQITTQMGVFECTDKHKIAVISDVYGNYIWKKANELEPGDRMVFVDHMLQGTQTKLPSYTYTKPNHSTTCKDITIPDLDTDIAWLLGLIHGDGYVYLTDSKGEVSIAIAENQLDILSKATKSLQKFGINTHLITPTAKDRCYKLRVSSKQLADYLSDLKQPKTSMTIPEYIMRGLPDIRAAYVAGLFDADGCADRPLNVASSVYPDYLEQVQAVLASLGVQSRLNLHKDKTRVSKGWQPLYKLTIVGEKALKNWEETVAVYCSEKYQNNNKTSRSQYDYGFPAEMMKDSDISIYKDGNNKWDPNSKQITVSRLEMLTGSEVKLIPVEIFKIEHNVRSDETYDISTEEHEFVAQGGYLVHNTAEIMFGDQDDTEFIDLKQDKDALYDRRWASNNSIFAKVGMDYAPFVERIATNGEPGFIWLDHMRDYSRMNGKPDNKDRKAMGSNPCSEQTLEDHELCCLVETFPAHHESLDDYQQTLKFAYLYAKTVTLIPTHYHKTNAVMMRNRRIGTSMSGITQAIKKLGRYQFLEWCDAGYNYIKQLDKKYSDWLCIPKSIKVTSVKPSGTVSLLAGSTPGIHYPHSQYYIRRVRLQDTSPLVQICKDSGYHVEPDVYATDTVVVEFPVEAEHFDKSVKDVTIFEQFQNASDMQKYWADNQVSITVTFSPEEVKHIETCLNMYDRTLKSISLLPHAESSGYKQLPYEEISEETYLKMLSNVKPLVLTGNTHESEDKFCDSDSCVI